MKNLYCLPTVFVIGDEYEILLNTKAHGLAYIKVGDTLYYEENSGVLPSEKKVFKIRVPQKELDSAKQYEVIFRKTKKRQSYYSTFYLPERLTINFKPIEKTENINIYHLADVHGKYEYARETAKYFGDNTDLFVINGDVTEANREKDFLIACKFLADIAGGNIPVIFSRGNHDTRGLLAERYTDYFPCQGKNTFFDFSIGIFSGVVLDGGEDKDDYGIEYDSTKDTPHELLGTNRFSPYRKKQGDFLEKLTLKNSVKFAVSHICPMMTTDKKGGNHDIEREEFLRWTKAMEKMGIDFMLCGHDHKAYLLLKDDERNILPHEFPAIVGSAFEKEDIVGTALIVNKNSLWFAFTDSKHNIRKEFNLTI